MSDTVEPTEDITTLSTPQSAAVRASSPAQTKSLIFAKLLRRGKGATLAELQDATAWQPHSVRAFLSGLRKKGEVLVKEQRRSGDTAYRNISGKAAAAPADA
jgi:hypothetical protein